MSSAINAFKAQKEKLIASGNYSTDYSLGLDQNAKRYLFHQRALRIARENCRNASDSEIVHPKVKIKSYWLGQAYADMELASKYVLPSLNSNSNANTEVSIAESDSMNDCLSEETSREELILQSMYLRHERSLELNLSSNDLRLRFGKKSRSLLHIAITRGDYAKFQLLLRAGIDVNASDCQGVTALMLAISGIFPHQMMYMIDDLLAAGADVTAADLCGKTALHRCCQMYSSEQRKDIYLQVMKKLISAGARVDRLDNNGSLPIDIVKSRNLAQATHLCFRESLLTVGKADRSDQLCRMWARVVSRLFVKSVFSMVLRPCAVCRRQEKDCQSLKKQKYKYWLFVHNKIPR